jgi:hypothetical protein
MPNFSRAELEIQNVKISFDYNLVAYTIKMHDAK